MLEKKMERWHPPCVSQDTSGGNKHGTARAANLMRAVPDGYQPVCYGLHPEWNAGPGLGLIIVVRVNVDRKTTR